MIVVGALPIVTTVMACGLHPFLRARSFASQSVNEPAVDTPILLPLSWSSERIGESHGTPILRNEGGPAVSQIAVMGAPLATSAISVPAPTPISMLPAAIACASLLPPVKSTIVRSSPRFLKMPSLSPTLTGMIGSAFGAALPTVRDAAGDGVEAAIVDPIAMANAASNRPGHRMLTMTVPRLLSGVLPLHSRNPAEAIQECRHERRSQRVAVAGEKDRARPIRAGEQNKRQLALRHLEQQGRERVEIPAVMPAEG